MRTDTKHAIIAFGTSIMLTVAACTFANMHRPVIEQVHAAAPLTVTITHKQSKSKCPVHWIMSEKSAGYAPYKNPILVSYQDMLCDRGITKSKELKMFTANLLVENGALSEKVIGDHGCSIGIPQRNVCQYGYSAKSFLRKYPAWNNATVQLAWMAGNTKGHYDKYNGDIFRTVVAHNRPASAARNVDSCGISPCYYVRVTMASNSLISL